MTELTEFPRRVLEGINLVKGIWEGVEVLRLRCASLRMTGCYFTRFLLEFLLTDKLSQ